MCIDGAAGERSVVRDPGVCDEHVDAPQGRDRARDRGVQRGLVGYISGEPCVVSAQRGGARLKEVWLEPH